ncbi:MAG: YihY/virulence factor BrkB family protein [Clostridiales bacterium]|nr:YihY/virulence factor BrkB family protein [Clostridiales bacterium]
MTKKKEKQSKIQLILGFMNRVKGDHVSAYASQAAYFLIMSFIPFLLLLMALIPYTPLTYNTIREAILSVVPDNLQSFMLTILVDVYKRSTAVVPFSAIVALWSSAKGTQSITNGLNTIYHVKETRGWLITRLYSIGYMLLFVVAIVVSLVLLVLGNRLQLLTAEYFPVLGMLLARLLEARTPFVFGDLFFVFLLFFKVLPNRKASFRSQVPGALFTAVAWLVFSFFFSLYFTLFPNFGNMYGSLAALILVMLWLYVCMNLILYGAEINAYFENQFREAQNSVLEALTREREGKKEREDRKSP